jgi:hypothetical protein
MGNFSTDGDLMKWEPDVFRLAKIPAQKLAGGTSGTTTALNATLTDSGASFVTAGVQPGHVVHLVKTGVYDLYATVATVNTTALGLEAAKGLFSGQTGVTYELHTFDPQHEEAHFELCQRFGITGEEKEFAEEELTETRVLRRASAFRVLEMIFRAGASDVGDLFWQKGQVYGELFATAVEAARVRFDVNADGKTDVTRCGNSVRLRVEEAGDGWPT